MQTIIMPGQQVVSTLVAQMGGEEEAFVQLLAQPYTGERCVRTASAWQPSQEFAGCKECTLHITAAGQTRQLRLVLGSCQGGVNGALQVVVDRYCKGNYRLTSNVLHLKPGLSQAQLHSAANSIAAIVFRGKNWADRNGIQHPEQTGDVPISRGRTRRSGGHHGSWRWKAPAAQGQGL